MAIQPAQERKQRQQAQTSREILDAAARAFARHGFADTTMAEIAREAGYTAGALYTYFESKEAIHEALLHHMRSEVLAPFDDEPQGAAFAEKLEWLLRRKLEALERHHAAYAVLLQSPETLKVKFGDSFKRARTAEQYFNDWLKKHATPDDLGGVSTEEAAFTLTALQQAAFRRFFFNDHKGRFADEAPRLVRHFLYGIRGKP